MDFGKNDQQFDETLCRVCQQEGCFEMSENEFHYETTKVTLLIAFNTFSSLDNDGLAMYLCQPCTNQLIEAYKFAQQVKLSDERVQLLQVEIDLTGAETNPHESNDIIRLLETDDDSQPEKITLKRTRKTRKHNDSATKRKKTDSSPQKSIQNDVPGNFALTQYVVTSNTPDDAIATDERNVETTTTSLELDSQLLEGDFDGQTSKFDNEISPTRNNVKTLKTSAVVAPNLNEIGVWNAMAFDGDHDSQSIYQCKYCPKAFAGPYHLMVHTRKSHQCQYCLSAFAKVTDLYKHVKETHSSFDCLLCGRTFRTNGNLRQHMRKNHSVFLPAHVSLLNASEAKGNDGTSEATQ